MSERRCENSVYPAARMREEDKIETIQALAEVINVDGRVSTTEIAFFNDVATAMSLTPAEIMGLRQEALSAAANRKFRCNAVRRDNATCKHGDYKESVNPAQLLIYSRSNF